MTDKNTPDRPSAAAIRDKLQRIRDAGQRLGKLLGDGQPHSDCLATIVGQSALAIELLDAARPAEAGDSKLVAMLQSHRNYLMKYAALFPEGSCMAAELDEMLALAAAKGGEEMSPEFTDTARAALCWVLWHHQGGSSDVGQPIRFALGMGEHDRLAREVAEFEAKGGTIERLPMYGGKVAVDDEAGGEGEP